MIWWPFFYVLKGLSNISINKKPIFLSPVVIYKNNSKPEHVNYYRSDPMTRGANKGPF
jgi:hypothetical protein